MDGKLIAENRCAIRENVNRACEKVGRAFDVQMLAVSKGQPIEKIRAAHQAGHLLFGENYEQEWAEKSAALLDLNLTWHFIGHLQSNKVKSVVGKVALIHSLDRDSLAKEIGARASALGVEQAALVEVNVSGEASKSGLAPGLVAENLRRWSQIKGLKLAGVMVMPPPAADAEASRVHFRQTKKWFEEWRSVVQSPFWTEISMGTSQDYVVAVEEGATIIRVGTVLFGARE